MTNEETKVESAALDRAPLRVLCGDALEQLRTLPDASVQTCVTSPPYWGLRDYGVAGQMGLERTPEAYVARMVEVFREVRRVLRPDGTCWVNLGDCYNAYNGNRGPGRGLNKTNHEVMPRTASGNGLSWQGVKNKDLIGIPWRVAFALQGDGWWLRCDIVWHKPNPMPESVTDRPTRAHEFVFLLSKAARYFYDAEAIREPGVYDMEKRLGQPNFHNQTGGSKDTKNGNRSHRKVMENLKRRSDKQRGHSRRHAGFNDRWDAMEKVEQCGQMRNKRSVWTIGCSGYPEAHFATYPEELVKPCILAGSRAGDVVLDPFAGSGTTGRVALELGRRAVLIELNPEYCKLIERRCDVTMGLGL